MVKSSSWVLKRNKEDNCIFILRFIKRITTRYELKGWAGVMREIIKSVKKSDKKFNWKKKSNFPGRMKAHSGIRQCQTPLRIPCGLGPWPPGPAGTLFSASVSVFRQKEFVHLVLAGPNTKHQELQ